MTAPARSIVCFSEKSRQKMTFKWGCQVLKPFHLDNRKNLLRKSCISRPPSMKVKNSPVFEVLDRTFFGVSRIIFTGFLLLTWQHFLNDLPREWGEKIRYI